VAKRPTLVVAGLVAREGKVLIGQRQANDRHGLKWEFPGGKVEAHETPKQALKRELREELGIEAEIGTEVARYEHASPGRSPLLLIFLRVPSYAGEPRALAFEEIRWEPPAALPGYDFLDGDLDLVRRLARGALALEAPGLY
jgi:8-oxo-dGTP diphosphatase